MLLFDDGVRRLVVRYVQLRGATYYYRRRYPRDLKAHFGGAPFKFLSLETHSPSEAAKRAKRLAEEDDMEWSALRTLGSATPNLTPADVTRIASGRLARLGITPGVGAPVNGDFDPLEDFLDSKHWQTREFVSDTGEFCSLPWDQVLDPVDNEMIRLQSPKSAVKKLSDALEYYLKEHERGRQKKFAADNRRSVGHVTRIVGDWPLGDYRRVHAEKVRDGLLPHVKTQTVRRHLNDIGAVFAKGIIGFDLQIARHPFMDVPIVGEGSDASKKVPFNMSELHSIVDAVRRRDDPLRHITALLVNTGARISEIVGLQVPDVVLDHATPHVIIRPNAARTLKTGCSERKVPLVGVSLWAAERALCGHHSGAPRLWLFPGYIAQDGHRKLVDKSASAGAALNKWLKGLLAGPKTSHCFRHTLRDRLRVANVADPISDAIGGWGTRTVGQGYGEGHALALLHGHLLGIAI